MNFKDYEDVAMLSAIYNGGDKIIYPAIGLGNESGEVLGKIKKVLRDKSGVWDEESRLATLDECGDVLWYLAALTKDLGSNLSEVADINIKKLLDRRARNVIGGSGDKR